MGLLNSGGDEEDIGSLERTMATTTTMAMGNDNGNDKKKLLTIFMEMANNTFLILSQTLLWF